MILADALQNDYDVAEICAAVVIVIGGVGALIRWLIRHELRDVRDNTSELKPNGGSHLADQVTRIEATVNTNTRQISAGAQQNARLIREVSALTGAFKQYVKDHDPR